MSAPTTRKASMAVAMMVDNPKGSQEIYERVRELLGMEKPAGASSTWPGRVRTAAGA
jgi:hypothetical protein